MLKLQSHLVGGLFAFSIFPTFWRWSALEAIKHHAFYTPTFRPDWCINILVFNTFVAPTSEGLNVSKNAHILNSSRCYLTCLWFKYYRKGKLFQKYLEMMNTRYFESVCTFWLACTSCIKSCARITQQNSYSISHLLGTVTIPVNGQWWCSHIVNCWQHSDLFIVLLAVVKSNYTVTVQSLYSYCAY